MQSRIRILRQGTYAAGLQSLCSVLPNNLIMAEIGSFSGESAEIFLKSGKFKKIICIDTWEDAQSEDLFDAFANSHVDIIKKVKQSSQNVVNKFPNGSFDFVYIDADHSYNAVKRDIVTWKDKVKPNGIIGGHDFHIDDVKKAVMEVFGKPHNVFTDNSWIVFLKKIKS